jgi:hypothetical protein
MKKIFAIALAAVLLLTLAATPTFAAKPGTDFNGSHYTLNIIGKKADWSGTGSYNNPDRHTMFVPEYTDPDGIPGSGDEFSYTLPDGTTQAGSIKIEMTQSDQDGDWAVLDGNAFDDGTCSFQLAKGKYDVYIVAKAKPGFSTNINGWVWYTDNVTNTTWTAINAGSVTVNRKWQDISDIFYIDTGEDALGIISSDTWVFDYLNLLAADGYGDGQYFWDYNNSGNKLVQVRFYPHNGN